MVFEENFFSEYLINESMNLTPIPTMHLWSPVKSMDSNWEPTIPLPGGHHDGDFGQNCVFDVDCGFRVFGVHMMVMVLTRHVIMMMWRKKVANWHLPKTMCWQFDEFISISISWYHIDVFNITSRTVSPWPSLVASLAKVSRAPSLRAASAVTCSRLTLARAIAALARLLCRAPPPRVRWVGQPLQQPLSSLILLSAPRQELPALWRACPP